MDKTDQTDDLVSAMRAGAAEAEKLAQALLYLAASMRDYTGRAITR